jgi:hypothetical protein
MMFHTVISASVVESNLATPPHALLLFLEVTFLPFDCAIHLNNSTSFLPLYLHAVCFSYFPHGVRLSPLGTAGHCLAQIVDNYNCGAIGGMRIGKGNRNARRKPAPVPHCPPQFSCNVIRARTRAAAVGSPELTA